MENGPEAELDDQLGYNRYDYKNKDTDNSWNGHISKTLHTSFGDIEVSVPRDRKSEFEPKVLRKNQTSISQAIEDIFIACTDNLTGFSAAIEAVYPKTEIQNCIIHQLRKVTKSKSVFPTDDSLFKMLYLAIIDITKKWTGRRQDWSMIHAQLAIYFEDRMPG